MFVPAQMVGDRDDKGCVNATEAMGCGEWDTLPCWGWVVEDRTRVVSPSVDVSMLTGGERWCMDGGERLCARRIL